MNKAVIVSAVRTPIGKAPKGIFKDIRPDELATIAVNGCLDKVPYFDRGEIEDVILGCAFPELEQGLNVARTVAIRAGLPHSVPGVTVNRFCASGLQAIAMGFQEIMTGTSDVVIAGGVESMSMVPIGGSKLCPNPYIIENYPEYYMSMGLTAEQIALRYNISREEQDEFSLNSYMKTYAAYKEAKFKEEIVPVEIMRNGRKVLIDYDEVRPNMNMGQLGKLRPIFKVNGTVTPGNSSSTNDGASATLIMSEEKAAKLGLKPLATLKAFAVAGLDPDVMGLGPVYAIPKVLKKAGLKLEDIGLIELNEAFAAQSIQCIKMLHLNREIMNVNGGAIALGHPLGCTGSKLTATLLSEMGKRNIKYGLISMCIGGGMGAAAIFERK